MSHRLFLASPLLCLCIPVTAWGQSAPEPDVARVVPEEIVVTATRSPEALVKIGSSITIIDRATIEARQSVVISDLLSETPGVSFSRTGGVGAATSLRIRGAETDQTVVVIDGVKLNDPAAASGGYNFANLLANDIARIEILRGAQSTLWGSQAIGGVVNIVTAEPTRPLEADANLEGGTHDTVYGRAGVGGASDRLVWRVAGDYYNTKGWPAYAYGKRLTGYHNAGASGRFRLSLSDDVSIDLRSAYSHGRNDFDGFPPPAFVLADDSEYGFTKDFIGYAGLNASLLDGRFKNRIAFAYTLTKRDNFNPDQAVTQQTFDSLGKNKRVEYQGTFAIAKTWNAVFGAESETSSIRTASPSSFSPNPVPLRGSVTINSGYLQLQGQVYDGLTLTGGIRHDSHDTFGGRTLGQAAAAYALNDGATVLRASFGQGFKAPTLYQLYSIYGNTSLRPEQAKSWDAGVEQHLAGGAVILSATYFGRRTRNQIDFVSCPSANSLCTPGRFGFYDNVASSRADGVELAASAKVDALAVEANYTFTDTENTSPGSPNLGKELARRPKHAANLSATYMWPRDISTGFTVRYVGNTYDDVANKYLLAHYTLVDLRAAIPITRMVELYGRIENLFDKAYQTARAYGSPGRSVLAGVRARF